MKKRSDLEKDEITLFRDVIADVAPIKQDKIPPHRASSKQNPVFVGKKHKQNKDIRQAAASFHFSDGFEAHFSATGPLKYVKPGCDTHEVKRLRRGEYPPDLILDLHGCNKEQAKLEIAALIHAAQKQHCHCVCVVHGLGAHILKNQVPNWLVQHPAVEGFHQAPLEWGGKGALLVLIEQSDDGLEYRP